MRSDTYQISYFSSWEACTDGHNRPERPIGQCLLGKGGGRLLARQGNGPRTFRLGPAGIDATPSSCQPHSNRATTGLRGYCKVGSRNPAHYRAHKTSPLGLPTVHTVIQQVPQRLAEPVRPLGQICRPEARASPKPLQERLRSRRPTHLVADGYASSAVPDSFSDIWQPF